ncbi:ComF family protein [Patescibacteria group bacterium]
MLERGFNQSDILAQIVASCLDGEYYSDGLIRIKNTVPQADLSKPERASNLVGAFRISPKLAISGKHVMLVDDVATTCATMESAAVVLRKYGARSVHGLSFARGKMT